MIMREKNFRIRTYVINLPQQTERREKFEEMLPSLPSLDVSFVAAVYGKDLSKSQLSKLVSPDFKRHAGCEVTSGEVGCVLSHRLCYEKMLKENEEIALVLEDDVLIHEFLDRSILSLAEYLKRKKAPSVLLLSARTVSNRLGSPVARGITVHRTWTGVGAYGYLITRDAAKFMLNHGASLPIKWVADDWFKSACLGLHLYACCPHLVSFLADRSDSTLHEDREARWLRELSQHSRSPRLLRKIRSRLAFKRVYIKMCKIFLCATDFSKTWPVDK